MHNIFLKDRERDNMFHLHIFRRHHIFFLNLNLKLVCFSIYIEDIDFDILIYFFADSIFRTSHLQK